MTTTVDELDQLGQRQRLPAVLECQLVLVLGLVFVVDRIANLVAGVDDADADLVACYRCQADTGDLDLTCTKAGQVFTTHESRMEPTPTCPFILGEFFAREERIESREPFFRQNIAGDIAARLALNPC